MLVAGSVAEALVVILGDATGASVRHCEAVVEGNREYFCMNPANVAHLKRHKAQTNLTQFN